MTEQANRAQDEACPAAHRDGGDDLAAPRVRRSLHRGRGWHVRFQVLGERQCRYFSDRHYGSAEAALIAAAAHARQDLAWHRELLGLHRRLAPRATCRSGTPGVARYDATPQRGAHWLAYFNDSDSGRRKSRRFAISVHGEQGARLLAIAWRARAVAEQIEHYQRLLQRLGGDGAGRGQITSL